MAFTTWAAELARWKDALANRSEKQFFLQGTENRNEMRVMYTKLGNIAEFTEWLEGKAAMEAIDTADGGGGILMSLGGA